MAGWAQSTQIEQEYISAWKQFNPSQAVSLGLHDAIFHYEDWSKSAVDAWIKFNIEYDTKISQYSPENVSERINMRLIRIQISKELDKWLHDAPHEQSLSAYAKLIAQGGKSILSQDFLDPSEQQYMLLDRLDAVRQLCHSARTLLITDNKKEIESGIADLRKSVVYYSDLPKDHRFVNVSAAVLEDACEQTNLAITELIEWAEESLLPKAIQRDAILGAEMYARKWAIYSDADLSPDSLASLARMEIEVVKQLMYAVAKTHWKGKYGLDLPASEEKILARALADMESDVTSNAEEYTIFWNELADSLIEFLQEKEIATVPDNQTLSIKSAPESAGPAARIGWVSSAPPFAPNPWTTLYLPSIPDTVAESEQIAFWASFNKPFNRMIAIHELFPGHYMQIKVSRETPHTTRLLFPYGPYFEGWATFTEKIVLDAGWDADQPLTMLAHLRKRLENANRAYTSVMVHCHGWDRNQVLKFSTEVALLAPQFAQSLWGRLMRGPMQMTSYFYGGKLFHELYQREQEMLGDEFVLKEFMNRIMRAGPIPVDAF